MNEELLQEFIDHWGQTALLWQRLRQPILAEEKITPADKRILYGLYRVKEITKKELAKLIVLEHSSLTRSLERLERQGFIKRIVNKQDKRAVSLSLTSSGRQKTKRIKQKSLKLLRQFLTKSNEESIRKATTVLRNMQLGMDKVIEAERGTYHD